MRAVEYDSFGPADVLVARDVADEGDPGIGQVKIRVAAASVNPKDTFVRKGRFRAMTGERFPRRTGYDFSGVVEAVGSGEDSRLVGQAVYGMLNGWPGGACAEQVIAASQEVAAAPASLPLAHAAAIPLAAMTALQAMSDIACVGGGTRVLVNGASGGVGLFAVQIAKALGAEVTAVASAANREFCLEAGADEHLDYKAVDALNGPSQSFDAVFDVFGDRSFEAARAVLTAQGVYVTTVPKPQIFDDMRSTPDDLGLRARLVSVHSRRGDLERLAAWTDAGQLRPVIGGTFSLNETAQAHRHVETKHTRGKVLVVVEP